MALSLILRNASKIQGYPCILRCTPLAFKNTANAACFTRSAFSNAAQKTPLTLIKQNVATSPKRFMSAGGDHRLLWSIERLFSLALVGVLPATIATPNPILDNVASVLMVLHFHWGIEAMVQDYVRPIIFGNAIPKVALLAVYIISAVTLGGLMYFNYNDVGIGQAVRKLWAIKPAN